MDEIDQALSQNDKELAIRLAHTVKGVSGELSANTIYSVADELEKALIKGSVNVNTLLEASICEARGSWYTGRK